jgi:hypothetical protein
MTKKQTAVQWLVDNILVKIEDHFNEDFIFDLSQPPKIRYYNAFIDSTDLFEYVNKAIEMEKEQTIEFAMHLHKVDMSKTGTDILMDEAEQYYNKTYGKI